MISVYGSSDDNFVVEGVGVHEHITDEVNVYRRPGSVVITDAIGQGVRVTGEYAPEVADGLGTTGAVWRMAVEPLDEDIPIPWPVRVTSSGYTAIIEIDCGKDVTVELFPREVDRG